MYRPAGRASYAEGGHFVTCMSLRWATAKPITRHEVTAARAGRPRGSVCFWEAGPSPPPRNLYKIFILHGLGLDLECKVFKIDGLYVKYSK
jgi:hypothetical protein